MIVVKTPRLRGFLQTARIAVVCMLATGLIAAWSGRAAAAADSPQQQLVRKLTDEVIAVLQQKGTAADAKREQIRQIVVQYVDFPTMARLVLARNWSSLPDAQKNDFIEEFKKPLS